MAAVADSGAGVSHAELESWVSAYERVWRAPGTAGLAELFSDDASYRTSPWQPEAKGLAAIAELWEQEREGPDEEFEMSASIVAVEGDTGVARVEVSYGDGSEYRDLWVVRFAADGRCAEFEEWAFWPGQPLVAPR